MESKHRAMTPAFKAKVALAAAKGDLTVAEISAKYSVHAPQVNRLKKQ